MNPVNAPTERMVDAAGLQLHVVEQGTGPAVIVCHGFPGLAYSWRHQLPVLAASGFRAVAPDMRGYGTSGRPADPAAYDRSSTVADIVALMDHLEIETAVFAGHDFGAADDELGADPAGFLARVFWALGGGGRYLDIFGHRSEGNGYLDVLPQAPPLPWPWLSEEEFGHYVEVFTRTGFTGGLNWYRAADHIWREKQSRPDEPVTVPTVFITGDRAPVQQITGSGSMDEMRASVPGLTGVHVILGAGHFVQMEAPARSTGSWWSS